MSEQPAQAVVEEALEAVSGLLEELEDALQDGQEEPAEEGSPDAAAPPPAPPSAAAAAAAPRGGAPCNSKALYIAVGVGLAVVATGASVLRRLLRKGPRGRAAAASKEGIIISDVRLLPEPVPKGAEPPVLSGLKFVVSDVFDIEGHTCSIGRPVFKENTEPAESTAPVITTMVSSGAELVGAANVSADFLSLHGRNTFYGNPPNPTAPSCISGGCHGGAACAVAAGMADFAVAPDGFGGMRVPSACCGLLGFLASPQAIPEDGVWNGTVNTSAVGWMARDTGVLAAVAEAALPDLASKPREKIKRVMVAEDLFLMCKDKEAAKAELQALKRAAVRLVGKENVVECKLGDLLTANVPSLHELGGPGPFENLQAAYTIVAAYECCRQSMRWAEENPKIAEALQESIDNAGQISEEAYKICVDVMGGIRRVMYLTLNGPTVLAIPTIGMPTIPLDSSPDLQEQWAVDAVRMAALAPMAASPQVCLPAGTKDGSPLSVSLVAQHHADMLLLDAAKDLAPLLAEEASKRPKDVKPDPEDAKKAKEAAAAEAQLHRAESCKDAGNRAFKEGKFEEAIRQYGNAIEADPKKATYYSNRAMASLKVMNFAGAEEDCSRALKLELNAKTLLRRGTARLGLHDFEGSQKDFKQVLALEPNNRQARIELRNLKEARERFEEMQAAAEGPGGAGGAAGMGNAGVFGGAGMPGMPGGGLDLPPGMEVAGPSSPGEHMQILDAEGNTVGLVDANGNPVMADSAGNPIMYGHQQ